MTLEEIRAAKQTAEADIRARLQALREATGMCPIGVDVELLDVTVFGHGRGKLALGEVVIGLEPI
jgi:hypothetical protein